MLVFSFALRRLKCSLHDLIYLTLYPRLYYQINKWPAKINSFLSIANHTFTFGPRKMKYLIKCANPLTHLLQIRVLIDSKDKSQLELNLPIWRPGRYEAANYAKNIQKIDAKGSNGAPLVIVKEKPSRWQIKCHGTDLVELNYSYYAHTMDAGNSFVDDQVTYINFINCLIYDSSQMNQPHEVILDLPDDYEIACSLEQKDNQLTAVSYYELADSPMIASANLDHNQYTIGETIFHIWIQGEHSLNTEQLIRQFTSFSKTQIDALGEFPVPEYHFLFHILPYRHYHGVEHGASTVITLGPTEEVSKKPFYNELLGVSSHELFHTWNILKIRPKELLPYNFSEPPVFSTGFVAEGFTTYYGDLFLKRSGVFTLEEYLHELEKLLTRHLLNFGRLNNSVIDSSLDLWFDGYQNSAPHKKSSIYVEGAVIALLLDLQIRVNTNHRRSLDDVMRILWQKFGKIGKGYSYEDIQAICAKVNGNSLDTFFNDYVSGTQDTKSILKKCLGEFGLELTFENRENILERTLGIILINKEENYEIVSIEPGSAGEKVFSVDDSIVAVNKKNVETWLNDGSYSGILKVDMIRQQEACDVEIELDLSRSYFKIPKVVAAKNSASETKMAQHSWLNVF